LTTNELSRIPKLESAIAEGFGRAVTVDSIVVTRHAFCTASGTGLKRQAKIHPAATRRIALQINRISKIPQAGFGIRVYSRS